MIHPSCLVLSAYLASFVAGGDGASDGDGASGSGSRGAANCGRSWAQTWLRQPPREVHARLKIGLSSAAKAEGAVPPPLLVKEVTAMALVATSRFAAALAENNVQNPPTSCSDCQRGLGSISYAVQEWAKCKCQTPSFCPTCAAKPSARAIFPTRSPALLEHEPWIKLLNDDASDALFPRAAAAPEPKAPTRNEALASAEEADRREAGDQLDGAISVIRLVDYIDDLCGDDHPRNAFSPEHGSIKFVIDKLGELLQVSLSLITVLPLTICESKGPEACHAGSAPSKRRK